jgi:hypothetical protein
MQGCFECGDVNQCRADGAYISIGLVVLERMNTMFSFVLMFIVLNFLKICIDLVPTRKDSNTAKY